jgi:hypothetical protein
MILVSFLRRELFGGEVMAGRAALWWEFRGICSGQECVHDIYSQLRMVSCHLRSLPGTSSKEQL